MNTDATLTLARAARLAITEMRDACREGRTIDHHKRDLLVMAAHEIIDRAEDLEISNGELLFALKETLRLADLQGQPRVVGIMQAAIKKSEGR